MTCAGASSHDMTSQAASLRVEPAAIAITQTPPEATRALGPAGMMAVAVGTQPVFLPGDPQVLFDVGAYQRGRDGGRSYAVTPDSERFLMIKRSVEGEVETPSHLIVVKNWHEELKRLVPVD